MSEIKVVPRICTCGHTLSRHHIEPPYECIFTDANDACPCEGFEYPKIEPVEQAAPPRPRTCGQVAGALHPRLGLFYGCVLTEGHEGEHKPGGNCFAHGKYVGTSCPQWPKCAEEMAANPEREPQRSEVKPNEAQSQKSAAIEQARPQTPTRCQHCSTELQGIELLCHECQRVYREAATKEVMDKTRPKITSLTCQNPEPMEANSHGHQFFCKNCGDFVDRHQTTAAAAEPALERTPSQIKTKINEIIITKENLPEFFLRSIEDAERLLGCNDVTPDLRFYVECLKTQNENAEPAAQQESDVRTFFSEYFHDIPDRKYGAEEVIAFCETYRLRARQAEPAPTPSRAELNVKKLANDIMARILIDASLCDSTGTVMWHTKHSIGVFGEIINRHLAEASALGTKEGE